MFTFTRKVILLVDTLASILAGGTFAVVAVDLTVDPLEADGAQALVATHPTRSVKVDTSGMVLAVVIDTIVLP